METKLLSAVGEVSIGYKRNKVKIDSMKITSPDGAYEVFKKIYPKGAIEHHEIMYSLFLSRNNTLLGYACISVGGVSGTICDPKIVFQYALKLNASGIILAHNHPSEILNPVAAVQIGYPPIQETGKV